MGGCTRFFVFYFGVVVDGLCLKMMRGWASGYEMCLKRLCNLVKSRVLADLSIKIEKMDFRTFVYFFELF